MVFMVEDLHLFDPRNLLWLVPAVTKTIIISTKIKHLVQKNKFSFKNFVNRVGLEPTCSAKLYAITTLARTDLVSISCPSTNFGTYSYIITIMIFFRQPITVDPYTEICMYI